MYQYTFHFHNDTVLVIFHLQMGSISDFEMPCSIIGSTRIFDNHRALFVVWSIQLNPSILHTSNRKGQLAMEFKEIRYLILI